MHSTSKTPNVVIALIPWVLFSVLATHVNVELAAVLALIASAGVAAPGVLARKPKILELGAVAGFATLTVICFALTPDAAGTFALYARGLAAAMLAVLAFASLAFVPFTEQYARERVPSELWDSPRFKAANRRLTAMWGCVFAAMVPLHVIAGAIDTQRSNLIFNWALPVLLVVWAMKRSEVVADAPVLA